MLINAEGAILYPVPCRRAPARSIGRDEGSGMAAIVMLSFGQLL
jgi:hypothetical protein